MVERRQQDQPVPVERRRGRPRSEDPAENFTLRIPARQREQWTQVASVNGMTLAAFIRQAVDDACRAQSALSMEAL